MLQHRWFHHRIQSGLPRMLSLGMVIAGLTLLLLACTSAPTAAPTHTALPPAVTSIPATDTAVPPTETATEPPTPPPPSETPTQAAARQVSFAADVLPILESRCVNCHGGERIAEGLNLKSYDQLMAGSKNGAVVVAGNAEASSLVTLAAQGKMPKRGPKLTPEQLQILTDWVNAGALNN